jgi:hypothetical protein
MGSVRSRHFVDRRLGRSWRQWPDDDFNCVASDNRQRETGYRITGWITLQGTYPVFMRIDYYRAQTFQQPARLLGDDEPARARAQSAARFGTGASATPNVQQCAGTGTSSSALASNSFGSASTGRAHVGLFVGAGSSLQLVFSIERTKDASGNDTGDGLLLVYTDNVAGGTSCLSKTRYLDFAGGTQPPAVTALLMLDNHPSSFGGDSGIGLVLHFYGAVVQPGLGMLVLRSSDLSSEAILTGTIYGAPALSAPWCDQARQATPRACACATTKKWLRFSAVLQASNSTDALFRAGQFVTTLNYNRSLGIPHAAAS